MIFLDKASKREKDENGYLIIKDNPVAVAGVFDYLHSELFVDSEDNSVVKVYRDFEEMKKIKDTFSNKPIVFNHQWVGNETNQVDGVIATEIRIDDNKKALISDLIIYNPVLIEAIERGESVELSPGFTGDIIEESGRFNGQSYDFKQVVKVANHLAVVENGRAGDILKIQDSKDKLNGVKNMKKKSPFVKFADSLRKFLDEEVKKEEEKVEDEISVETEDMETEDSADSKIREIIKDTEMSEDEKVKAIESLYSSEQKAKDEDSEQKAEDEIPLDEEKEVEAIGDLIEQVIEKKLEKYNDSRAKIETRILDAYDKVQEVLGTSFNRTGKTAEDIYKFGYEQISGEKLGSGMNAETAFSIVAKSQKKEPIFRDSKSTEPSSLIANLNKLYK